jgi:hypothetical protein
LGGCLYCCSKGTKRAQGDHINILVAAIPNNPPTKIHKAALSRGCGTPRRFPPEFSLKACDGCSSLPAYGYIDDNLWLPR